MHTLHNIKPIAKGLATYIIPPHLFRRGGEETADAAYCYSVLMRHAVKLHEQGLNPFQGTIAELGPGASLGVGIGALIAGANNYIGLDLIDYDCWNNNAEIYDKLLPLFQEKRAIPSGELEKNTKPILDNYDFPSSLLPDSALKSLLNTKRIGDLRTKISRKGGAIRYSAPWMEDENLKPGSVDWIFSQAVLEHVDDLENTYRICAQCLKPGGFMSHQIDFKSHGFAQEWNGHWRYTETMWKVVRGTRKYAINREPASTHTKLIEKYGLKILLQQTIPMDGGLPANKLAKPYRSMSAEDQNASGLFVIAQKPV